MKWPEKIIVEAWEDFVGVKVRPISAKYANVFAEHVSKFTGRRTLEVYFQEHFGNMFIDDFVPKNKRDLIKSGPVRFLIDPWIVGTWYGYDAHTIVESWE